MQINRRFRAIILTTFTCLFIGLVVIFGYLIDRDYQNETARLTQRIIDHGLKIDRLAHLLSQQTFTLATLSDDLIGTDAEISLPAVSQTALSYLATAENQQFFHGDAMAGDPALSSWGNITGLGELNAASPEMLRALRMAARLNPRMAAIAERSELIRSVYYWAETGLEVSYPWRASDAQRFTENTKQTPIFQQLAEWAKTPIEKRKTKSDYPLWTQIEMDPISSIPMLRLATPVGLSQNAPGVVGVTVALTDFNLLNDAFAGDYGKILVMATRGDAIAHPNLVNHLAALPVPKAAIPAQELLRSHRAGKLADILAQPERQLIHFDDGIAVHFALQFAPWRIVYFGREDRLIRDLLRARAPAFVAGFLFLVIFAVTALRAGRREFATPMQKIISQLQEDPSGDRFLAEDDNSDIALTDPWLRLRDRLARAVRERLQIERRYQSISTIKQLKQSLATLEFPDDPRFAVYADSLDADDEHADFHDVFPLDNGNLALFIGSVSGRGQSATHYAIICHTILKTLIGSGYSPAASLAAANKMLCRRKGSMAFATALVALYAPDRNRCTIATAAHTAPTLLQADGQAAAVPVAGGPALGVIEDMVYDENHVQLAVRDTIVFVTPGIDDNSETGDRMRPPLVSRLIGWSQEEPRDLVTRLLTDNPAGRRVDGQGPSADAGARVSPRRVDATSIALQARHSVTIQESDPPAGPRLVHNKTRTEN